MKIPYQNPNPAGSERARAAKTFRDLSTEIARLRPQAATLNNGEESERGDKFPSNFTKGLKHDDLGLVHEPSDYLCFVEAINSEDRNLFEKHVETAESRGYNYLCKSKQKPIRWRGWESPRAGHVFELEGPDPGAVAMAPAPRVGSSELSAEMAEVYAMAILRDVSFENIAKGRSKKLCDDKGESVFSAKEIAELLNKMPFFNGKKICSSTPLNTDCNGLNSFEKNRRHARTLDKENLFAPITTENLFRGSTPGAHAGPYISQFLLIGSNGLDGPNSTTSANPHTSSCFGPEDGFIQYGNQIIDQRITVHKDCLDYMTDWSHWLDVQNGGNFKGLDQFRKKRRFITTPRDLATYVHFDALYQAYLNACLILLGSGAEASRGFPEPSPSGKRDAFATFGGPHILSLVTEVATRCLKAVRRQKFNYHRRARPEALGGRFVLSCIKETRKSLGECAWKEFYKSFNEIPFDLCLGIIKHNKSQNSKSMQKMRAFNCKTSTPGKVSLSEFNNCNVLLPMAFPEGSPMHPAYGAGHATVAGGCVTMLKAFFEMYDKNGQEKKLKTGAADYYVPNATGTSLVAKNGTRLTIQGELDKLAANIAIGRNMAGVHYYSDYYDSLRMGERIAVGILMEQAPTYNDEVATTFTSFDGDFITISGEAGSCPTLSILNKDGEAIFNQRLVAQTQCR